MRTIIIETDSSLVPVGHHCPCRRRIAPMRHTALNPAHQHRRAPDGRRRIATHHHERSDQSQQRCPLRTGPRILRSGDHQFARLDHGADHVVGQRLRRLHQLVFVGKSHQPVHHLRQGQSHPGSHPEHHPDRRRRRRSSQGRHGALPAQRLQQAERLLGASGQQDRDDGVHLQVEPHDGRAAANRKPARLPGYRLSRGYRLRLIAARRSPEQSQARRKHEAAVGRVERTSPRPSTSACC